jgi:hypothetical protein
VVASSDSQVIGAVFNTDILQTGTNTVRERDSFYEGGFFVKVKDDRIGALYFGAIVKGTPGDDEQSLMINRFTSIGNLIAHSEYVEDVYSGPDQVILEEYISRVMRDVPDITFMHFVDDSNQVIASSSPRLVGKLYKPELVVMPADMVREKNGFFEGGFFGAIVEKGVKGGG